MTPVTKDLTAYIGTTFGPYIFTFNQTASVQLGAVTFDVPTDVVIRVAHGLVNGDQVRFTTTGALPTILNVGVYYYVVSATTDNFKVSLTAGGAAINLADVGFGTHSVYKRGIPLDLTGWAVHSWAGSAEQCDVSANIDLAATVLAPATNGRVQILLLDTVTVNWKVRDLVYSIILKNTANQWLGPYVLGDLSIRNQPTLGTAFVPPT